MAFEDPKAWANLTQPRVNKLLTSHDIHQTDKRPPRKSPDGPYRAERRGPAARARRALRQAYAKQVLAGSPVAAIGFKEVRAPCCKSIGDTVRQQSKLHLVVPLFAGASAYCFRFSYEQPNPVALAVAGGVFFAVAAVISLVLKIDREDRR